MRIDRVTFVKAYEEMGSEMLDHWDEVPFGNFDMDLDLDHGMYVSAELEGYARFYLVYIEDEPVAYMSVFASKMAKHQGEVSAVTDAFYVSPDYRKSGVFAKLVEFVEQDMKSCGIRFFTVGCNPMYKGRTDLFLESIGYCKTEVLFTKEL